MFESANLRDCERAMADLRAPAQSKPASRACSGSACFTTEGTLGSLDLYGYRAAAFDETSHAMGTVLAAPAAMSLAAARVHTNDLGTIAGLNEALHQRDVIGQAKGMRWPPRHRRRRRVGPRSSTRRNSATSSSAHSPRRSPERACCPNSRRREPTMTG